MSPLLDNFFNRQILAQYGPSVLAGFWVTVEVALLTIVVGVATGLALAMGEDVHDVPGVAIDEFADARVRNRVGAATPFSSANRSVTAIRSVSPLEAAAMASSR